MCWIWNRGAARHFRRRAWPRNCSGGPDTVPNQVLQSLRKWPANILLLQNIFIIDQRFEPSSMHSQSMIETGLNWTT